MKKSEPGSYAYEMAHKSGNLPVVDRLVKQGMEPSEAINRTCHDVYSYNEAMATYGLRAVVPD